MADDTPKLVEKELLAGSMYLGGTDRYRGDVVELTEEQAERLTEQGMVAEVGTLDKLRKERAEAEEAAREREAEQVRLRDDEARERGLRAQRGLTEDDAGGSVADDTATKARDNSPGDPDPTAGARGGPRPMPVESSQSGPKVTKQDGNRSEGNQRGNRAR